jgi:TraM recognition site of TraD and TraG
MGKRMENGSNHGHQDGGNTPQSLTESLTFSVTRRVDSPLLFSCDLLAFRGVATHPLTWGEFTRLVKADHAELPPKEMDVVQGDAIYALSDDAIRAATPTIAPVDFRRLRAGFLMKEAHQKYKITYAYQTQILNFIRPILLGGTPAYLHYTSYLETHHSELEAFFSLRALPVSPVDLKAHSYISAGSGHGKSELMKAMMYALMNEGHGVILLDPHGDIAEQVTHWKEFEKDGDRLCYFSPYLASENQDKATPTGNHERLFCVPGINPLSGLWNTPDLDATVENFIATMTAVIGSDGDMTTRMKTILKPCLYTLAAYPNTTLYDLLAFVSESEKEHAPWVDRARDTLKNRALLDTLESFFDKHYATTKSAIRDRLRALLSSDALDKCLTTTNTVDLESLMNSGKVVVFNLAAGILGNDTSAGFGRFILTALQSAAMKRQHLKAHQRKSVFLFMDEADRFMSESVVSIVKETRKYGLHLTMAQQTTGYRMSTDMWAAISGNSRVRFAGASGGDYATERDLSRMVGVDATDLQSLQPLSFYMRIGNQEAVKISLKKNLLGNKNRMSEAAWERVKAHQIATYYRVPPAHTATTPTAEDHQSPASPYRPRPTEDPYTEPHQDREQDSGTAPPKKQGKGYTPNDHEPIDFGF